MAEKAKIKNGKKDINISIEIENNLLSKNKMKNEKDEVDEKVTMKAPVKPAPAPLLSKVNQNLLSEYLAITSARDLYNSNRSQPLNLTQVFSQLRPTAESTPQGLPLLDPTSGVPVSGNPTSANPELENLEEITPAEAFDPAQYTLYTTDIEDENHSATLAPIFRTVRNNFIKKLETNPRYKIRKQTIKDYNLAYKVSKLRPDIWEKIKNGTWRY